MRPRNLYGTDRGTRRTRPPYERPPRYENPDRRRPARFERSVHSDRYERFDNMRQERRGREDGRERRERRVSPSRGGGGGAEFNRFDNNRQFDHRPRGPMRPDSHLPPRDGPFHQNQNGPHLPDPPPPHLYGQHEYNDYQPDGPVHQNGPHEYDGYQPDGPVHQNGHHRPEGPVHQNGHHRPGGPPHHDQFHPNGQDGRFYPNDQNCPDGQYQQHPPYHQEAPYHQDGQYSNQNGPYYQQGQHDVNAYNHPSQHWGPQQGNWAWQGAPQGHAQYENVHGHYGSTPMDDGAYHTPQQYAARNIPSWNQYANQTPAPQSRPAPYHPAPRPPLAEVTPNNPHRVSQPSPSPLRPLLKELPASPTPYSGQGTPPAKPSSDSQEPSKYPQFVSEKKDMLGKVLSFNAGESAEVLKRISASAIARYQTSSPEPVGAPKRSRWDSLTRKRPAKNAPADEKKIAPDTRDHSTTSIEETSTKRSRWDVLPGRTRSKSATNVKIEESIIKDQPREATTGVEAQLARQESTLPVPGQLGSASGSSSRERLPGEQPIIVSTSICNEPSTRDDSPSTPRKLSSSSIPSPTEHPQSATRSATPSSSREQPQSSTRSATPSSSQEQPQSPTRSATPSSSREQPLSSTRSATPSSSQEQPQSATRSARKPSSQDQPQSATRSATKSSSREQPPSAAPSATKSSSREQPPSAAPSATKSSSREQPPSAAPSATKSSSQDQPPSAAPSARKSSLLEQLLSATPSATKSSSQDQPQSAAPSATKPSSQEQPSIVPSSLEQPSSASNSSSRELPTSSRKPSSVRQQPAKQTTDASKSLSNEQPSSTTKTSSERPSRASKQSHNEQHSSTRKLSRELSSSFSVSTPRKTPSSATLSSPSASTPLKEIPSSASKPSKDLPSSKSLSERQQPAKHTSDASKPLSKDQPSSASKNSSNERPSRASQHSSRERPSRTTSATKSNPRDQPSGTSKSSSREQPVKPSPTCKPTSKHPSGEQSTSSKRQSTKEKRAETRNAMKEAESSPKRQKRAGHGESRATDLFSPDPIRADAKIPVAAVPGRRRQTEGSVLDPIKFNPDFRIPKKVHTLPNPLLNTPQPEPEKITKKSPSTWLQKGTASTSFASNSAFSTKVAPVKNIILCKSNAGGSENHWSVKGTSDKGFPPNSDPPSSSEGEAHAIRSGCNVRDVLEGLTEVNMEEEIEIARSMARNVLPSVSVDTNTRVDTNTPKNNSKRARSRVSSNKKKKRRDYSDDSLDWTPRGCTRSRPRSRGSSHSSKPPSPSRSVIASRTRSRTRSPSARAPNPFGFSHRYSSTSESEEDEEDDASTWTTAAISNWLVKSDVVPPSPKPRAFEEEILRLNLEDIRRKRALIFSQSENNYVSMDKLSTSPSPPAVPECAKISAHKENTLPDLTPKPAPSVTTPAMPVLDPKRVITSSEKRKAMAVVNPAEPSNSNPKSSRRPSDKVSAQHSSKSEQSNAASTSSQGAICTSSELTNSTPKSSRRPSDRVSAQHSSKKNCAICPSSEPSNSASKSSRTAVNTTSESSNSASKSSLGARSGTSEPSKSASKSSQRAVNTTPEPSNSTSKSTRGHRDQRHSNQTHRERRKNENISARRASKDTNAAETKLKQSNSTTTSSHNQAQHTSNDVTASNTSSHSSVMERMNPLVLDLSEPALSDKVLPEVEEVMILDSCAEEASSGDIEIIDLEIQGSVNINQPFEDLWRSMEPQFKCMFDNLEDCLHMINDLIQNFVNNITKAEKIKMKFRREKQYATVRQDFLRSFNESWEETEKAILQLQPYFVERDLFNVLSKKLSAAEDLSDPQSYIKDLEQLSVLINSPVKTQLARNCGTSVTMAAKLYMLHRTKQDYLAQINSSNCFSNTTSAQGSNSSAYGQGIASGLQDGVRNAASIVIRAGDEEIPRTPSRDSGFSGASPLQDRGPESSTDSFLEDSPTQCGQEANSGHPNCCNRCGRLALRRCLRCNMLSCDRECQICHCGDGHSKNLRN